MLAENQRVDAIPEAGFSYTAIANRPPAPFAGDDVEIEATGPTTQVHLDGTTSVDPDGDDLSFEWRGPFGRVTSPTASVDLGVGTHVVELLVADAHGFRSSDSVTVSVIDTTPPSVTAPGAIAVPATSGMGVRPLENATLAAFLDGGWATDLVDYSPVRLPAQVNGADTGMDTWFPVGVSTVMFRFEDASGNLGTATSTVTVLPPTVQLTVTRAGAGSGVVTSSPTGIQCGSICSFAFPPDTVVSLTAAPDASSLFASWSGSCTGTGPCQVTMTQAQQLTATFTLKPMQPKLSAALVGKGGEGSESFADVRFTNTGVSRIAGASINQVLLRRLAGSGNLIYGSPTLPLALGALEVGEARTVRFVFTRPSTVTRYSITEGGTILDDGGTTWTFSLAQSVIP